MMNDINTIEPGSLDDMERRHYIDPTASPCKTTEDGLRLQKERERLIHETEDYFNTFNPGRFIAITENNVDEMAKKMVEEKAEFERLFQKERGVKRIVITGFSRPHLWYAKHLNEIFEVTGGNEQEYYIRNAEGETWCVYKQDAEPYTETLETAYDRATDAGQPWPPERELAPGDF